MKRSARPAPKKPSRIPVAHWSADEWRENADDLVRDPERPQACPATYPMDLMGRIRVKLTAEGGDLVAYGFGGQRIVLPHKSIGAVRTVDKFRMGQSNITRDNALLVLDRAGRILLRASGLWETYGEVQRVCQAAKLPSPSYTSTVSYLRPGKYQSRPARNQRAAMPAPRFEKAPEKDVSTLSFKVGGNLVQDDDPSIGGRPLPLDSGDPKDTSVPETIVYLPDNHDVAAARQQITGSVWHGAPTANLISGGILTLALPPFGLFLVLRLRRLRWKRASGFVEDLTA